MMLRFPFTSAVLLLLPLCLTDALQQFPVPCLSLQQRISLNRPISYLPVRSAVAVETVDSTAATQISYDWDEQFDSLLSFKEESGHCNFPRNAPDELRKKYPALVKFCHDQRLEHIEQSRLCKTRMTLSTFDRNVRHRRLEEVGFEFSKRGATWYDMYQELVDYHNLHGHVNVPSDNRTLQNWTHCQRRRQQKLSESQIDLLNQLDFRWESRKRVDWTITYNQLVDFHKRHGHLQVKLQENAHLYHWTYTQRVRRNGDSDSPLTEDQIRLLDEIGFRWEANLNESRWHASYNELVEFKNKHGHLQVSTDEPLSGWIVLQRQRRARKTLRAPLSNEQLRLLDGIGFPWEPDFRDVQWRATYQEFASFLKQHGPPTFSTNSPLHFWSLDQQNKREKGLLTMEQVTLLDKIDFVWQSNHREWSTMYKELLEYIKEHHHLQVNHGDSPKLYDWVTVQRQRYHGTAKPSLSDEGIEKLEEIHFCWSLGWRERVWHEKYTEAVEFYKEHGHVRVSKKDNCSLYNWIQTQGKRYKEKKGQKPLSAEELELLEQIDFAFFQKEPRMAWNAKYAEVKKYRMEKDNRFPTGHKDDPNLNRWMRHQRKRLRGEYGYVPLPDEQKSLLESIGFPMQPKLRSRRFWNSKYDELVDFRKQHGHFLVSVSKNASLGNWVARQREMRNRSKIRDALPKSKVYLLDQIGFPWTSDRLETEWQMRYDDLVQFLEEQGHFPRSLSEDSNIYKWVGRQRARYKGKIAYGLSDHQIEQLEMIGMVWSVSN